MATKTELDAIDGKLLRLLGSDARASYQALADEVGLSRPAVMERVKRLEEGGFITGYSARLDRARLGFPVTAFVAVRYPSMAQAASDEAIRGLVQHPGVLECHHVAGEDCYIIKVAAPTVQGLEDVLRALHEPKVPVSTRTTIVLSTVFEKPGVVLPEVD